MLKRSMLLFTLVMGLFALVPQVHADAEDEHPVEQVGDDRYRASGILVVGTQTEVNDILYRSGVKARYKSVAPNAMVAVALTNGKMRVYEGKNVDKILDLIGGAVVGGVVLTLKTGSVLWNLLASLTNTVFYVGANALHAAIWVLSHTGALILNGVTFLIHVAGDVIHIIGWIIGLFIR